MWPPWPADAGALAVGSESGGMTFINTDGLTFLGPGSEWFWTAVSAVAVVVTLVAIYRAIAHPAERQGGAAVRCRGARVGVRAVHPRTSRRCPVHSRRPRPRGARGGEPARRLVENLASLIRAGHLIQSRIVGQWGGRILVFWTMLRPTYSWSRVNAPDELWTTFEWLSNQGRRHGKDHSDELTSLSPEKIARWIGRLEEELAIEEAMRAGPAAQ